MIPEQQKVVNALTRLGDAYEGLRVAHEKVQNSVNLYASSHVAGPLPQFPALLQLQGLLQPGPSNDALPAASTSSKKRTRGPNKVKKIKDPNAPKRPVSAYLIFQNEVKDEVRAEYPEEKWKDVMKRMGQEWKELSKEEKKPYEDEAHVAMEKWKTEKKAYLEEHDLGSSGVSPVASGSASGSSKVGASTASIKEKKDKKKKVVSAGPSHPLASAEQAVTTSLDNQDESSSASETNPDSDSDSDSDGSSCDDDSQESGDEQEGHKTKKARV